MTVTFTPSHAQGKISAPPSKSMAHRLLISAGLANGESIIENLSPSEDVLATIDCLRALGATCDYDGKTAIVRGINGTIIRPSPHLPCRECGSTLRFFIPIAAISREITTFSGSERLFSRPLSVYESIFRRQNLPFFLQKSTLTVGGVLKSGNFTVKGNISSQFISGLLFALPLLSGDSTITLLPPVESRSYLDLSLQALRDFGIQAHWQNETTLFIQGCQTYQPRHLVTEGDYSNAAFFSALVTALVGSGCSAFIT